MLLCTWNALGGRPRVIAPPPPTNRIRARTGAMPAGPAPGSRLTPEFVREIGRFAYLWAWPLVNVYNRYSFKAGSRRRPFSIGGVAPVAPINHLAMLHDYNQPEQRYITCPSQDLSMASAFSISAASRSSSRCRISASASGSSRRPISGPTASPISARCTAPSPASICWSAPTGTTTRRRTSRRRSAADQYRHIIPRVFQAGRQGRQRGAPAADPPDPGLSAVRVRRHDEDQGLDRPSALSLDQARRRGMEMGRPRDLLRRAAAGARCRSPASRRGGALCAGALGARCGGAPTAPCAMR